MLPVSARAEQNYFAPSSSTSGDNAASAHDFRLSWGGESSTPESLKMKELESPALRDGSRAYYEATDSIKAYAGAGFERDPGYLNKAGLYGYNRDLPGNGADFGVGELGITVKPSSNSDFSVDLNTKGYTGTRDGVEGKLQFKWEF